MGAVPLRRWSPTASLTAPIVAATLAVPSTAWTAATSDAAGLEGPTAAPPAGAGAEPVDASTSDNPLDRAKQLYDRGKNRFDTADYGRAIELWTEAYGALPDTPDAAPIKAALIYNIATARERAYAIDDDVTHLRRAVILLEQYSASIPALYGEDEAGRTELEKVQTRIEQIREKIAEAEARKPDPDPVVEPDPGPDPDPGLVDEPTPDPRAKAFIISGAVLTGLGVVGLGVMAGGLVMGSQANDDPPLDLGERRSQFDRGQAGNTMAYVGGAIGGVMLIAGATLLGLGLKGRKGSIALAPTAGPRFAGLRWTGRF